MLKNNIVRWVIFLVLALPLGYIFTTATLDWSLAALLLLCILYASLRPFRASLRMAIVLLVAYLGFAGLLSFSQPLFNDSWSIFVALLFASLFLQPVIALFAVDSIIGILDKTRKLSDMVAVVLLWIGTLAILFGSTELLRTGNTDAPLVFVAFLMPWLVNGCIFLVAALLLTFMSGRAKAKKRSVTPRRKAT